MAELKFDMTRLANDVMEKVLDETEYKGRTLRDWIDGTDYRRKKRKIT